MIAGLLFNFFFGFLAGIVLGWSKKAFFWLAASSAVGGLILVTIFGQQLESSFDWLRFVLGIIITALGIWGGERGYTSTFGEKD